MISEFAQKNIISYNLQIREQDLVLKWISTLPLIITTFPLPLLKGVGISNKRVQKSNNILAQEEMLLCFTTGNIPMDTNKTFIALIPKVENPQL